MLLFSSQESTDQKHVKKKPRAPTKCKSFLLSPPTTCGCEYVHIAPLLHLTVLLNQASEILRHPYLQPYVNQYRPSPDPSGMTRTPETPVCSSRGSQKNMSDSQNSSISSSDMDSLHSSERNTSGLAYNSDNKMAESDCASTDDVGFDINCTELHTTVSDSHPPDEKGASDIPNTETRRQSKSNSVHVDRQRKVEPKQPKTVRNILVALKEEVKASESSYPMRGSRVKVAALPNHRNTREPPSKIPKPGIPTADQSSKIPKPTSGGSSSSMSSSEVSGREAAKTNSDSVKRVQPPHALKHRVWSYLSFFSLIYSLIYF